MKKWTLLLVVLVGCALLAMAGMAWTMGPGGETEAALADKDSRCRHQARQGDLSSCKLDSANLAYLDLTDCLMVDTDLRGANMSGAYMVNANMCRCNLHGVFMGIAVLDYAVLCHANLSGMPPCFVAGRINRRK